MAGLTLSGSDLAGVVTNPANSESLSMHGGVSHIVVEVDSPLDLSALGRIGRLPGLGLVCPVVAVSTRDLVDSCGFADVVLAGDGPDGPPALDALGEVIGSHPVAAAAYALLLRNACTEAASSRPSSVPDRYLLAGLVAESSCYSMLQAGAEFAEWRAGRPRRVAHDDGGERVRVTRRDDVLDVTLARPGRRNALDAAMRDALVEAFTIAMVDPDLRVCLRGDGPSFSAGGDLDEFGARPDPAQAHITRLARSVAWLACQLGPRMEAHLHGACMGSGIELPAFAASVLAAEDTTIGLPEISLGLIPGAGGTVSITRRIGRRRTAFLGLSGMRIDAGTALEWGLVDTVIR